MINTHINLLGYRAIDKISGFEGVIDCISFDLYGCIQATLRPKVAENNKTVDTMWFDVSRLNIDMTERVMEVPDFNKGYIAEGKKGSADKPNK